MAGPPAQPGEVTTTDPQATEDDDLDGGATADADETLDGLASVDGGAPHPGWWVANNGEWYPPELHPDYDAERAAIAVPAQPAAPRPLPAPAPPRRRSSPRPPRQRAARTGPRATNEEIVPVLLAALLVILSAVVAGYLLFGHSGSRGTTPGGSATGRSVPGGIDPDDLTVTPQQAGTGFAKVSSTQAASAGIPSLPLLASLTSSDAKCAADFGVFSGSDGTHAGSLALTEYEGGAATDDAVIIDGAATFDSVTQADAIAATERGLNSTAGLACLDSLGAASYTINGTTVSFHFSPVSAQPPAGTTFVASQIGTGSFTHDGRITYLSRVILETQVGATIEWVMYTRTGYVPDVLAAVAELGTMVTNAAHAGA